VKFFVDNNIAPRVARALHCLVDKTHSVVHLREYFPANISDIEWMGRLSHEKDWIIITGDRNISRNPQEVLAWKNAGHTTFFLKPGWTNITPWEQASQLCNRFPNIIKLSEKRKRGTWAYEVPLRGTIEVMKI